MLDKRDRNEDTSKYKSDNDDCNNNLITKDKLRVWRRIVKPSSSNYTFIALGDFDIVWINVIIFILANMLTLYSYPRIFLRIHLYQGPIFVSFLIGLFAGIGITAGAHRLWAHRTYKAKLPLRVFLMIGQTIAGQNTIYTWSRDHRVHHKYSDTNGDPHNTRRGFFFA